MYRHTDLLPKYMEPEIYTFLIVTRRKQKYAVNKVLGTCHSEFYFLGSQPGLAATGRCTVTEHCAQ